MRFQGPSGEPITSIEEWAVIGAPVSPDQWAPGRSACELATTWIDGQAAERVAEVLSARPEFADLELLKGVAEKETQFDENPRGPRHHDLLIHATSAAGPVVIGVEGKADEPFDEPLWRWRKKRLADSPKSGAPERLDGLTRLFFRTTIDKDRGYPALACLGYQLLSGLAGTLADAKKANADRAVFLVHEFETDMTTDEKHQKNRHVLEDFLVRLYGCAPERDEAESAWITAPTMITGDGEWMPKRTLVSIAKLITDRRPVG